MDTAIVARLIRIGRERVSPRGVRSAEKAVTPLDRWVALDRDEVVAALARCFAERCEARFGELHADELEAARALSASKYATSEWVDRIR